MDVKFHISKIIDSGNNVNDWSTFINQVKGKCDRDLVAYIYKIALDNITETHSKGYKKLLVGLANLQSETSPELARQTFQNANCSECECAVVCVYFAQFEYRHNKSKALKILRSGKCDGRVPNVLLKNAYQNFKSNKLNLFDGIVDPWDESLHDATDTFTFNEPKSFSKTDSRKLNITRSLSQLSSETFGKPKRFPNKAQSASNILNSHSKKSNPEEAKSKLSADHKLDQTPSDDSAVFLPSKIGSSKSNIPSLSPFQNNCISPLVSRTSFSFTGNTPETGISSFGQHSTLKNRTIFTAPKSVSPDSAYSSIGSFENTPLKRLNYSDCNSAFKSNKIPGLSLMSETKQFTDKIFITNEDLNIITEKPLEEVSKTLNCLISNNEQCSYGKHTDSKIKMADIKAINYDQELDALIGTNTNKNMVPMPIFETKNVLNSSKQPSEEDLLNKENLQIFDADIKNRKPSVSNEKTENPPHNPGFNESKLDIVNKRKPLMTLTNNKNIQNKVFGQETNTRKMDEIDLLIAKAYSVTKQVPTEDREYKNQVISSVEKSADVLNQLLSNSLTNQSVLKSEKEETIQNNHVKIGSNVLGNINKKENMNNLNPQLSSFVAVGSVGYNLTPAIPSVTVGYSMTPDMPPPVSTARTKQFTVNGKVFAQVKCIGKGGSCKVYEVLGNDGQLYALKRVKLQDLDSFMIDTYVNEIKWLEKLKGNPTIIELFEWEQNQDYLSILLEKGDTDLAHVLRNTKTLTVTKMKEYWKQMLLAVNTIHNVGIIHTDLKPANFLFVGELLKLIDFGIANKVQDNRTSLTREYQMGTVNYMPPEALMSDASHSAGLSRISKASDVWSLGCMLYSMIFKKTPYQHIKTVSNKMFAIQQGQAIDYNGIEDSNLLDCLQGCLKYGKRERYTLQELLNHSFLKNLH